MCIVQTLSGSTFFPEVLSWFDCAAVILVLLMKREVLLLDLAAPLDFMLSQQPVEASAKLGLFLVLACLQKNSTKKLKGGKYTL